MELGALLLLLLVLLMVSKALIKQILDGNNPIEIKVDGLSTRVAAVERKTNDISERVDSTGDRLQRLEAEMVDMRRRQDTPVSLAAHPSGPTSTGGQPTLHPRRQLQLPPAEERATWKGPIMSFTGFPPNSDKFEIKKHIKKTVLPMLFQKHLEEIDGEPFGPGRFGQSIGFTCLLGNNRSSTP